jgi:hypothetical protein
MPDVDVVRKLVAEHLPHAPEQGLYIGTRIPDAKRRNAIADYADEVVPGEILALYDSTEVGDAKDGAVFAARYFVFQNTDLEAPQTVRYRDLKAVRVRRRLLGRCDLQLRVDRGRAPFELAMDFSEAPDAAEPVATFLRAMKEQVYSLPDEPATDAAAVRAALERLRADGKLSQPAYERMIDVLEMVT